MPVLFSRGLSALKICVCGSRCCPDSFLRVLRPRRRRNRPGRARHTGRKRSLRRDVTSAVRRGMEAEVTAAAAARGECGAGRAGAGPGPRRHPAGARGCSGPFPAQEGRLTPSVGAPGEHGLVPGLRLRALRGRSGNGAGSRSVPAARALPPAPGAWGWQ